MPVVTVSSATVKPTTPCLDATYADLSTDSTNPCTDAMLMIRPQSRASICGSAARLIKNTAALLTTASGHLSLFGAINAENSHEYNCGCIYDRFRCTGGSTRKACSCWRPNLQRGSKSRIGAGSRRDLRCVFRSNATGRQYAHADTIRRLGLDVGITRGERYSGQSLRQLRTSAGAH